MGPNTVLENLNLEVQEGEFLVLLGPSGCGKSTLLHSIAGLQDTHGGSIEIGGADVTDADPKDRSIGMVFQSYALYPTMSVEGNMAFGLRVSGAPRPEIERRIDKAARMLQLGELLKRRPAQLSGGQRQRVAIGRALVREAQVFLFDEPLSNLDAKLRTELRRELKELHRTLGSTMIYVTHDQVEAMTLATRVAVMQQGRIQQIGTPAEIYRTPVNMFVAGFLGAPSMNFLQGELALESGRVLFRAPGVSLDLAGMPLREPPVAGRSVVLGVRPEHVSPAAAGAPQAIEARVSLVEPMGAHSVVWLDAHGQSMAMASSALTGPAIDEPLPLALDLAHACLFDAGHRQRI